MGGEGILGADRHVQWPRTRKHTVGSEDTKQSGPCRKAEREKAGKVISDISIRMNNKQLLNGCGWIKGGWEKVGR